MLGTTLTQLIWILNTYFTSLRAEYILLTSLGSLFGGFTCFLVGIYAYISDISHIRARTSRVAFLDLFVFLGFPVGMFLSASLFKVGGYYLVFGTVSCCSCCIPLHLICIFYPLSVCWIYHFGCLVRHFPDQRHPRAEERQPEPERWPRGRPHHPEENAESFQRNWCVQNMFQVATKSHESCDSFTYFGHAPQPVHIYM